MLRVFVCWPPNAPAVAEWQIGLYDLGLLLYFLLGAACPVQIFLVQRAASWVQSLAAAAGGDMARQEKASAHTVSEMNQCIFVFHISMRACHSTTWLTYKENV